jgi:hypothetical protein
MKRATRCRALFHVILVRLARDQSGRQRTNLQTGGGDWQAQLLSTDKAGPTAGGELFQQFMC